ncbi:TOBE domain-containing protein [Massilia sp. METH4]|uniref:TOBE domain-containing protein n=1 Tax=Massilia sp. METH4 TaxID=3123041 RepID=UPI0030CE0F62
MSEPLELHGKLWLAAGGRHLGGANRIALLAAIAQCGSITRAARAVGMSYKGAWDAVDAMNNLAGTPLVERLAGGKGGGGTRLTERGAQLVEQFRRLEEAHRRFVAQLDRQKDLDINLLQVLNMKTSARNQFLGTVETVTRGAVNDEVVLRIVGDQRIVAVVTHESAGSLGLAPGVPAFALVKASSIIIAVEAEGARLSARNQLAGTIARVVPGAVNAEVTIALPGGGTIAATVTTGSAEGMELVAGMPATALFKASSVIVGVPG